MEKKYSVNEHSYLHEILPLGCWSVHSGKKKNGIKSFFRRYEKQLDLLLAGAAIILMLLAGIWVFLIELAEFAVQP